VPTATVSATYNSRIATLPMRKLRPRVLSAAASLLLAALLPSVAIAADWSAAETELAAKIAAVAGPGAVALNVVKRSSLSQGEFEQIRSGLQTHLAALGVQSVGPEQAAATVQISLSENLQSYLWIAQIEQGVNQLSVVMINVPRSEAAAPARISSGISLHKGLLWSQAARILDVAVMDGTPTHMIVLDAGQVALYRLQGGRWQPEQVVPVTHTRPWPRDLRGRLVLRADHLFDAYLPGVFCRSTASTPLSLACAESDDPWPIGSEPVPMNAFFSPTRNFFTGALAPGIGKQTTTAAFYSAAALPREKYTLWLFASVEGPVNLLDGASEQTAGKLGWGSDIASVHTGCGSGWQVLASAAGESDRLRAFEFPDRDPIEVSQPLEFAGSITALWTEPNGTGAIVIAENPQAPPEERYEAFRLSITCGQ